jgi:hypothetical protein
MLKTKRGRKKAGRANRGSAPHITRISFAEATGEGWAAQSARGLTRWRAKRKLTISAAADKFKLDARTWYRIERHPSPNMVGANIDRICLALGVTLVDLLKLGARV